MVIKEQQAELLGIKKQITDAEKEIEAMRSTVKKPEIISENMEDTDKTIQQMKREVEDLWAGLDYLSNPYK